MSGRTNKPKRPAPETALQTMVAAHIHIKPSSIPGAGQGAWWMGDAPLPAHRVVGMYKGALHKDMSTVPQDGRYALRLSGCRILCAADPADGNWTRWVNDPRGTGTPANLAFTAKGGLRTLAEVPPGQELFVEYGDAYWGGDDTPESEAEPGQVAVSIDTAGE